MSEQYRWGCGRSRFVRERLEDPGHDAGTSTRNESTTFKLGEGGRAQPVDSKGWLYDGSFERTGKRQRNTTTAGNPSNGDPYTSQDGSDAAASGPEIAASLGTAATRAAETSTSVNGVSINGVTSDKHPTLQSSKKSRCYNRTTISYQHQRRNTASVFSP